MDQEIVNTRNIAALNEARRADRAQLDTLREQMQQMQQTIAMLVQQARRLEEQVAQLVAVGMGRGRTG